MSTFHRASTGDTLAVPDPLDGIYDADPEWARVEEPAAEQPEPGDLKGAALDNALEAAGLPKSGTADEKRARLAEHTEKKDDLGQQPGGDNSDEETDQ